MALLLLFRTEVNNSGITAKPPLVLSHHHMVNAVPFFARWMFPCVLTNVLVKPCVHMMVSSFSAHNDNSAFPLSFIFPTPLYSLTSSHLETSSCLSLLPTLIHLLSHSFPPWNVFLSLTPSHLETSSLSLLPTLKHFLWHCFPPWNIFLSLTPSHSGIEVSNQQQCIMYTHPVSGFLESCKELLHLL